jgi:hypothetical protein
LYTVRVWGTEYVVQFMSTYTYMQCAR